MRSLILPLCFLVTSMAQAAECVRGAEKLLPASTYYGKTSNNRPCQVKVTYNYNYGEYMMAEASVIGSSDFVAFGYLGGNSSYHLEKCQKTTSGFLIKSWSKCNEVYCGKIDNTIEVRLSQGRPAVIAVQNGGNLFGEKIVCNL